METVACECVVDASGERSGSVLRDPGTLTVSTVLVELAVMQEQDEVGDRVDVVVGKVRLG